MILLTGASGFIGSHLVQRLAPSHRLRCLVRPASASRVPRHPNVEIREMDLRDEASLRSACEGVRVVIHAAALLRTARPDDIFAVNAESTRVLVDACAQHGRSVEQFIFFSSENALRTDLTDAYPESKRLAESYVRRLPNHLILRPCFIYGPGDAHGLGRLANLVRSQPVVPLFGGLRARVQPIYIDDCVEMLAAAMDRRIQGEYTLAGTEAMDLNSIARLIARVGGLRRLFVPLPRLFWQAAAVLAARIPGAGWGPAQYSNIYGACLRDPEPAIRAFGVHPRGLEAAFRAWLASERS